MGEPKFIQAAVNSGGIATTANINRNGSGTLATIVTCGAASGLRIDAIQFHAAATTTANTLRVFLIKGADKRLIKEIAVTAVTPSNTAAAWNSLWIPDPPLILENDYSLQFAPATAGTYHASVISGGEL
jgi:hypothetical protein